MATFLSPDEIVVRPDLDALLRPLQTDEMKYLRQSMEEYGWKETEPMEIWGDTVLDGHNRLRIARELGIERIPVHSLYFESDNEAKAYMYTRQIGRRNLTDSLRQLYIGQLHSVLKEEKGSLEAARFLATQEGLTERTVFRYAQTAEAFAGAEPSVQEKFLAGEATAKELLESLRPVLAPIPDPLLSKEQMAERSKEQFPTIVKAAASRVVIGVRNLRALCHDVDLIFRNQGEDLTDYAPTVAAQWGLWKDVEAEAQALCEMIYDEDSYRLPEPAEAE